MSQNSGFFNALVVDGIPDRRYDANSYCENLAVVISNGVRRSIDDDLKVTSNGLICTVNRGRAWIDGHFYHNTVEYQFPVTTPPTGGTRWDRIVLRLNTEIGARNISLQYLQGVASATPTKPSFVRNNVIYDLVLADIFVDTNARSLTIIDQRDNKDLCGWVYSTSGDQSFLKSLDNSFNEWFGNTKDTLSSVTLFKRYNYTKTLASMSNSLTFDIPQYDPETCFIEVYVNGIISEKYTVADRTITFNNSLVAGTEITVKCYKSIDGTGIMSVADEVTQLQNRINAMEGISTYTYKCINNDDNISLSQIAQALYAGKYDRANVTEAAANFIENLGGSTFLANLPNDAHITIHVAGKCGVTTPVAGDGSSISRYIYFNLGQDVTTTKNIIFDFANCERILIECNANTFNTIIHGTDLKVKNLDIYAKSNSNNSAIQMIGSTNLNGSVKFEDCNFKIITTGGVLLARNGVFVNCNAYLSSATGGAIGFSPLEDAFVDVRGGTYRAYATGNSATTTIFYTYGSEPDTVIMAQNINCPTVEVSGFAQRNLSIANGGQVYINGVMTLLPSTGTYNTINGLLPFNKPRN